MEVRKMNFNLKKFFAIVMALCMVFCMVACGDTAPADNGDDDQAAADAVAALIDAIYVQEWTEDTDAQCAAAKEAWDALTDAQKELVEGEFADPDYFGRDTGDASKDDPRNADDIGENEILVVSFGTSFNDSRVADIKGIEDAIQAAYPEWSVRRAFTAQIIINHIQARDNEKIDNMNQALERAVANGVKNLVVQPTHLMQGAEYDELCAAVNDYSDQIENIVIAEPLLGCKGSSCRCTRCKRLFRYGSCSSRRRCIRIHGTRNFPYCKDYIHSDADSDEYPRI